MKPFILGIDRSWKRDKYIGKERAVTYVLPPGRLASILARV
jgi:hypothetical protein